MLVSIQIEINCSEYGEAPSAYNAVKIVDAILDGSCDWPTKCVIKCHEIMFEKQLQKD